MDDQFDLGIKYSCDSCFGDISQVVRIKCAQCTELDLCVNCFSKGVSVKDHSSEHDYYVIEPLTFPIYVLEWTAQEELLLLEGIEKKGMGNWNDIARVVGSKNAKECDAHYHRLYLESLDFPLPDPSLLVSGKEGRENFIPPTTLTNSQSSVTGDQPMTILTSQPASHEIAGFMPKRGDFECEYENDFENVIKDIQFSEKEDSPMEIQLKLAVLHNYCGILDKREDRKRFAFDRDLTQFKRVQGQEKGRKKEEKSLLLSSRQYARFLAPEGYETFLQGLLLEQRLTARISELQTVRKKSHQPPVIGVIPRQISTLLKNCSDNNLSTSSLTGSSDIGVNESIRSSPGYSLSLENSDNFTMEKSDSAIDLIVNGNAKRKLGIPIDLTDVEGVELLSNSEIELCSWLRLLPRVYLNIKETLLKEQAKFGYLKRAVARGLVKIDVNKTSRIYDFFVAAGWISPTKA